MWNGLGVIPNMGARAMTTACVIPTAFPGPKPAIGLPQHGWRLENSQVGRDGFEDFRRQVRVIETITEPGGFLAQLVVMAAPIKSDAVDIGKASRIPRPEICGWIRGGRYTGRIL